MHVAMIGFDRSILPDGDRHRSESLARHVTYARGLRERAGEGARLTVAVRVPAGEPRWTVKPADGLAVHALPVRRTLFSFRVASFMRELESHDPFDLVTTQTPFDDALGAIASGATRAAGLNVQMHSSYLDHPEWIAERPLLYRLFNALGKWTSRRARTVRVVSRGEQERLERDQPHLRGKVHCLHPLLDTGTFDAPADAEETEAVRRRLEEAWSEPRPYVLFVGRFVVQKNLPLLLDALARTQRDPHGVGLVLAGRGPLESKLRQAIARLEIDDRVLLVGELEPRELRGWYAAAVATVLPSRHEGFGRVIAESCLMETPVIVTPFASAAELVESGRTGHVLDGFDDAAGLADRISTLAADPETARRMGREGRERIERYLLPEEEYLDRLVEIWRRTATP